MNEEIQFILYSLPEDEGRVQVIIKDEVVSKMEITTPHGAIEGKSQ